MADMSASASLALSHLVPLAKEVDQDKVTPGVLGFVVFAVLAIAVWALMKSMNRHMAKVDFKLPENEADASGGGTAEATVAGGKAGGPGETGKTSV